MTVHIAFSGNEGAVILSDSQGSDSISEAHGFQKQYVGEGFILGGAGHGGILGSLFEAINRSPPTEAQVATFIEDYLESELRPSVVGKIQLLLLRSSKGSQNKVANYSPCTYRHFSSDRSFGSIGSGAHFVFNALARHGELGIEMPTDSLADMFVKAIYYADVANESLTVDDCLMASFIKNDMSYLIGMAEIGIWHAPNKALRNWGAISKWCEKIVSMSKTVNSEVREATRLFSRIRISALDKAAVGQLENANKAVEGHRKKLAQAIDAFCVWYDANVR